MASRKSSFLSQVDRGKEGKSLGLPNGLGSMNNKIFNTQPSRYYLIGGESGSGKTTLLDHSFVFSPYFGIREIEEYSTYKLSIEYFSFEQSARTKHSKWASHLIHRKHKIWVPSTLSLGKSKMALTKEQYEYCVEANDELEELLDCVNIVDHSLGPNDILAFLLRYGAKKGSWEFTPRLDAEGNQLFNKAKLPLKTVTGWVANDPDERHLILLDHIAYANLEKRTLKENIDTISRMIVKFREITRWTFSVLQQFNTDLSSVERQKYKKAALAPQRVDFGDSRYTFQDADVVIGTLNPYKYDILDNFQGYENIERFHGLATWAFLLKNRHEGSADAAIPYLMDPVGINFEEIPDPEETRVRVELGAMDDPLEEFYDRAEEISLLNKLYI